VRALVIAISRDFLWIGGAISHLLLRELLGEVLKKTAKRVLIGDSALRGRMAVEEEIEILRKDRQEHVGNMIAPALRAEKIVILDRYYFSTAA
jgi:thymidylate kinase